MTAETVYHVNLWDLWPMDLETALWPWPLTYGPWNGIVTLTFGLWTLKRNCWSSVLRRSAIPNLKFLRSYILGIWILIFHFLWTINISYLNYLSYILTLWPLSLLFRMLNTMGVPCELESHDGTLNCSVLLPRIRTAFHSVVTAHILF